MTLPDYENGYDNGYRAGMQKMRDLAQVRLAELEAHICLLSDKCDKSRAEGYTHNTRTTQ